MGKDDVNSTFDFDSDPEFSENFYKNIEMAFGDSSVETPKVAEDDRSNRSEANSDSTKATSEDVNLIIEDVADVSTTDANSSIGNITDANVEMDADAVEFEVTDASAVEEDHNLEVAAAADQSDESHSIKEASEEDIEDELVDINASLARKICEEMECIGAENSKQKHKKHRLFKIKSGILLTLLCLIGFGFFFGFTKPGNQLLMSMGVNLSGKIWTAWTGNFENNVDVVEDVDYIDENDVSSNAVEVDPNQIVWPDHPGNGRKEEGVYNILLLGEEAIGSGSGRGRTDVIVIATMNTNTKKLMLTSLMRDTFVQIPGFQDNKLNSAYEKGGLDLLYETIALNFDIQLDGCVKVNFENFENIVDRLGGLEITLTAGEAQYLNSTNYISKPQYRNVVEGTQLLNGNQVLGYSRVRKRSTITGNNNDYGRTDRHRIVLNAIFEKYKTKSKVELASLMLNLLPMITTDIDSDCFEMLLNSFIEMNTMELSQFRIPADNTFSDNVKVRGMDVLIPDLQANVEALHSFIFGEDSVDATTTTGTETTGTETTGTENSTTTNSNTTN